MRVKKQGGTVKKQGGTVKERIGKRTGNMILWMLMAVAGLGICGGAVIWARPTVAVTNNFDTGVVSIELRGMRRNDLGEEEIWTEDLTILPGMRISRIPRITNQGNSCYLRAKPLFFGTDELDETCLYGIGPDWTRAADGFYYYREIVPEGTAVDFFEGVQIPEEFDQEQEGAVITLEVQVDAIQSGNLEPDFLAESPWGTVEILEAKVTEGGQIRTVQTAMERKFVVEYQGEAAKLVINEENFFGNLPTLLPGDEYSDGAKLINNGTKPVRLFFRSIVDDPSDITDRIELVIETEVNGTSKVVYEGPLRAEELSADTLLMTIPEQSMGKMVFAVYVPEELDNAYALQDKTVQWIFSTEEIVLPGEAVNTGDNRRLGGYLMLSGLSLGFAVRMIQRKRREYAKED